MLILHIKYNIINHKFSPLIYFVVDCTLGNGFLTPAKSKAVPNPITPAVTSIAPIRGIVSTVVTATYSAPIAPSSITVSTALTISASASPEANP